MLRSSGHAAERDSHQQVVELGTLPAPASEMQRAVLAQRLDALRRAARSVLAEGRERIRGRLQPRRAGSGARRSWKQSAKVINLASPDGISAFPEESRSSERVNEALRLLEVARCALPRQAPPSVETGSVVRISFAIDYGVPDSWGRAADDAEDRALISLRRRYVDFRGIGAAACRHSTRPRSTRISCATPSTTAGWGGCPLLNGS